MFDDCSGRVIGGALKVHSALGPGLPEGAHEECLTYELRKRGLAVEQQPALQIVYDGVAFNRFYRVDLLVEGSLVVELEAVSALLPVHRAQLLSYLRLSRHRVGLLINFNEAHLRDGLLRVIYD